MINAQTIWTFEKISSGVLLVVVLLKILMYYFFFRQVTDLLFALKA